jgi:hypothetical protein
MSYGLVCGVNALELTVELDGNDFGVSARLITADGFLSGSDPANEGAEKHDPFDVEAVAVVLGNVDEALVDDEGRRFADKGGNIDTRQCHKPSATATTKRGIGAMNCLDAALTNVTNRAALIPFTAPGRDPVTLHLLLADL